MTEEYSSTEGYYEADVSSLQYNEEEYPYDQSELYENVINEEKDIVEEGNQQEESKSDEWTPFDDG